jgi:hypothetical protein
MLPEETILKEMNVTVWAYELVDELLKRMDHKNGYSIPFSINTHIGERAISMIKVECLATFNHPTLLNDRLTITQKGKDVLAAGGIEKFLDFWGNAKSNVLHGKSTSNKVC